MLNPDLTTENPDFDAKAQLTRFFWDRSVNALNESIQHLRDCDFFESVHKKLSAGAELTDDLPELKGMEAEAPAIIKKLHDDAMTAAVNCWELKAGAAKVFSTTIRTHDSEDSNIPCFDIEHSANTDDGITKVLVKTWRRNVDINVTGSSHASELAHKRLILAGMQ